MARRPSDEDLKQAEEQSRAAADAVRDMQQALAGVPGLVAEIVRLRAERDDALARAEKAEKVERRPAPTPARAAAVPEEAAAALGTLLSAPFHVTPQQVSAAQKDPLVALAVQVARAMDPDAKDVERARLMAMGFAASRGDLEAFWKARRMRTAKEAPKRRG